VRANVNNLEQELKGVRRETTAAVEGCATLQQVHELMEQRLQLLPSSSSSALPSSPAGSSRPAPAGTPGTPPSASRGGEQSVAALRRAMAQELSQLTQTIVDEQARTAHVEDSLGRMQVRARGVVVLVGKGTSVVVSCC
jgi:hypothetical protein